MPEKFTVKGIISALATTFTQDGEVDEEALRELVQFQLKSGVNGLYALGSTGMGPAMEPIQRMQVAELIVDEVNGRLPVIVQVGASNPDVSLELARHAEKTRADAIASLNPFYYHPGDDATIDYYEKLSRTTELPIFIYNIPSNTGNNIDAKLLAKLSRIPRIVGIKDSSRDFAQLLDYLSVVPEGFSVMNGTDSFQFSAFCAGVPAGVSATATAFPELFVQMYLAFKTVDLASGKQLQMKANLLRNSLSHPPIAPFLEALKMRGLKAGFVKAPLRSMKADEIAALRDSIRLLLPEMQLVA